MTPERVQELLDKVPIGHGWVVADTYPEWVVCFGPNGHPISIASATDSASARLIAAAPEIAQAYLELREGIEGIVDTLQPWLKADAVYIGPIAMALRELLDDPAKFVEGAS